MVSFFGVAAYMIEFYALVDYWNPNYLIKGIYLEDFLYGFFFGGLASIMLNFLFGYKSYKHGHHHYMIGFSFIVITYITFHVVVHILKLNSIVAHIIPPMIVGIISICKFKNYLLESILSGIALLMFTFCMFKILLIFNHSLFIQYWNLIDLSNIFIFSIPLEEYLFAFALGFGAPTFYELVMGYEFDKEKHKNNYINIEQNNKTQNSLV